MESDGNVGELKKDLVGFSRHDFFRTRLTHTLSAVTSEQTQAHTVAHIVQSILISLILVQCFL